MTPLRFCHITTFYPPYNFGGDGIDVQRLGNALARRGHEVTVVHDIDAFNALNCGDEPPPQPAEPGVRVIGLRSRIGSLSPALTQQVGRPVVHGRRLGQLMAEQNFDVINFHNVSLVGGPGALRLGAALKLYTAREHWLVCPTHVLWRHNREPCSGRECLRCTVAYRRPPQLWRYTGALERHLREVDLFIALSEFSRRKHADFGFSHEMEIVPPFLPDVAEEAVADDGAGKAGGHDDRPYFLFVGRLERLKGLDDVIPMFDDDAEADLLIAGTGEHEGALRALAAGRRHVRFLGFVAADDLRDYYRNAVAVVVPSVGFETFGTVIIEAFSFGVPVLARRVGPFPELVTDAGELFTTPAELRQSMQKLLHDPAVRARNARAAEETFRAKYCESVVVPQYLELVGRVAQRTGDTRVVDALSGSA